MIEIKADLFNCSTELELLLKESVSKFKILTCITTNGIVKKNGELTMGAGVALKANKKYPGLARGLGKLVSQTGNRVYIITELNVASFPTKHDWKENSDINLIERSCQELVEYTKDYDIVLLTRPGCGLGNLNWNQVKNVIAPILKDNKFIICNN